MVVTRKRRRMPSSVLVSNAGGPDAAASLKGTKVLVPSCALAALEAVHGPHTYLNGIVKGKDTGHKDCVLIKCSEDPRTFFFDVGQVLDWMQEQELHGKAMGASNKCAHPSHAGRPDSTSSLLNGDVQAERIPAQQRPSIGPPPKGITKRAEVADLIGREVEIPGPVFSNYAPGLFFRAYVMGPDSAHASAVVLRMLDNPRSRFYFHASEVREWLQMMHLRASAEDDSELEDQDTFDEALAAKVLANMSAGGSSGSSPSSNITSQLAALSPLCPSVHQASQQQQQKQYQPEQMEKQQQQQQPQALAPACVKCTPALSLMAEPDLNWGPTELIAQLPSLLPSSLAEQLGRITSP